MKQRIKVGAVSYRNTKPLLWGIEHSGVREQIDLSLDYPAALARQLAAGDIDLALLPVAAMGGIPGAHIVGNWGIGADGKVASVCIYSRVPVEEIEELYLDYQSRTSVKLAQVLLKNYWKRPVRYLEAPEYYIGRIEGTRAGVIIGDRALEQNDRFPYVYDLAEGWKDWTGLPFIFAAWVANKPLPADFVEDFDKANELGVAHIDEVVAETPFPFYSLKKYYTENIRFRLDAEKKEGLQRFLHEIESL